MFSIGNIFKKEIQELKDEYEAERARLQQPFISFHSNGKDCMRSTNGVSYMELTMAEYEALGEYSDNITYFILDESPTYSFSPTPKATNCKNCGAPLHWKGSYCKCVYCDTEYYV